MALATITKKVNKTISIKDSMVVSPYERFARGHHQGLASALNHYAMLPWRGHDLWLVQLTRLIIKW